MTPALRQQAFWLLCFVAGIWLGARSGHSTDAADHASHSTDANERASSDRAKPNGAASSGGRSSSAASSASSNASSVAGKPASLVKKTSLDDLRRLLALDPYECDLKRMFSDFEAFAKGLPTADLPAAAAMLWSSPHRMWSVMTLTNVLSRWADDDPKAPLDWLRGLKGEGKMVQLLRWNIVGEIGKKHPDLLWAEIGSTQEWMEDGWPASGLIAQGFASDLKFASKFLDQVTDPSVRYFALSGIAGELAKKDPADAITWLRSQPQSGYRDDIVSNMFGRLAKKSPDSAIAALNDTAAGLRERDRERILENLAEHHPERAQAIIAAGGLKTATMSLAGTMASRSTSSNNVEALLALAPEVPAGEVRDAYLCQIASKLSKYGDLDRAWKAIGDISPSLERGIAMRSYGQARAEKSIADATTWLSSLPSGADRDAAITGFAQTAIDKQPQMAIEWAAAITDPVYRAEALEDGFRNWHKTDHKAADAWLGKATTLSADDKVRLKEQVAED